MAYGMRDIAVSLEGPSFGVARDDWRRVSSVPGVGYSLKKDDSSKDSDDEKKDDTGKSFGQIFKAGLAKGLPGALIAGGQAIIEGEMKRRQSNRLQREKDVRRIAEVMRDATSSQQRGLEGQFSSLAQALR